MSYYGLGASLTARVRNANTATIQVELQRLGLLAAGTGGSGADGIWGPTTAGALEAGARRVGWTQPPYTPSNAATMRSGTVTVPDALITALRAAPSASSTPDLDAPVDPGRSTFIGPHLDRGESVLPTQGGESSTNWWPAVLVGGGVLAIGGILAVAMKMKTRRPALAANRRHRRRRRH